MGPLVETVYEDPRWEGFGLSSLAEHAATATLKALKIPVTGFSIVVMGCDDPRIQALNAEFREKDQPTNVLSWPSDDRESEDIGDVPEKPEPGTAEYPEELGDLALAWETCEREAAEQGKSMEHHVTHLLVHGVLHLLGYDHEEEPDAELMEKTESGILAGLGIADPY